MFFPRDFSAALACVIWCAVASCLAAADAPPAFTLGSNDVVAFAGGSDVAAAQDSAHLETLLAAKFPGARFRNFGWEGDTVFAQRRDVGFPPLSEHLKRARVTVLFLEFGRAEALNGNESVPNFFAAFEKLLNECVKQTPHILLVTPPPFESGGDLLPDLSKRNGQLAAHVNAIRTLAKQRSAPLVDLFAEFGGATHEEPQLTDNGLQFTPRGQALVAARFARQLGFPELASRAGSMRADGAWSNSEFEKLRQLVIEKNKLWFNYWRPQNWAFLGGDRTSQPSSRDHRNPNVRWFPAEMEKYVPLIQEKEAEIEQVAATIRGGVK
jgi:lysophospholipase L1-like esterase